MEENLALWTTDFASRALMQQGQDLRDAPLKRQSTVGAGIHGKGLWGFPTDAGSALWEECLVRFPLGPFRRTLPSSSSAAASWEGIGNCDQLGQDARKVGMQGLS